MAVIRDHEFMPSKRVDSCDFTDWTDGPPWIVCDYPEAAHEQRGRLVPTVHSDSAEGRG